MKINNVSRVRGFQYTAVLSGIAVYVFLILRKEGTGPEGDTMWHSRRWRRRLPPTGKAIYKVIRGNEIPFSRKMVCEWEDYNDEVGNFVLRKDAHTALISLAIPEIVF
jgi:hypothetical protein